MNAGLWLALLYLVAGQFALVIAYRRGWARDPGEYIDELLARDKAEHFAIAFMLVVLSVLLLHVYAPASFFVTLILGVEWEIVQWQPWAKVRGYFSWWDVLADAAGAAIPAALLWWRL